VANAFNALMPRVLVLYDSSYGHIGQMAEAVAAGVREAGAECTLRRVPELVPEEVRKRAAYVVDARPIAEPAELVDDDGIVIGTNELEGARFQGRRVAEVTAALLRGRAR
jgi:NAD(P)H dehydrogenase (quinone)